MHHRDDLNPTRFREMIDHAIWKLSQQLPAIEPADTPARKGVTENFFLPCLDALVELPA